jgi:hypothetical protein
MIEEALYSHLSTSTALTAIVSDRIYPMMMPQDPTLPAITYQRISNSPVNTLGGFSSLDNPHIQFDCWTTSYSAAKALGDKLRKALSSATTFNALQMSDQDLYEADTEIYRVSMDFSCWFKST